MAAAQLPDNDNPLYGGLASADELRQVVRLAEGPNLANRLKIGKKLGRGSEGDVYKAIFDGQRVALKVMKRRDRRAPKEWRKVVAEYLAEARLLRICNGQSTILGLHAAIEFPSSMLVELEGATRPSPLPAFGLMLDLSQRGTLRDLVEQQMGEPQKLMYNDREALGWCIDLAAALRYLHSLSPIIIHRDIKLENVLLFDGVRRSQAKLCDFGLAAIGYETLPPARRSNRGDSQNSQEKSRQASRAGSVRVDDTARLGLGAVHVIEPPGSAAARIQAAAERAIAAMEMEDSQTPTLKPTLSSASSQRLAAEHRTSNAGGENDSNGRSPQLAGRRVHILQDANNANASSSGPPSRGISASQAPSSPHGGPNARLLTLQLLQAQDQAAAAGVSRSSMDGGTGTDGRRTMGSPTPTNGTTESGRPLGGIGGQSTRRRMSTRQTVAFALPEGAPPGDDDDGNGSGTVDLPNMVNGDAGDNEESFNARRRLSRCSSANSFASRASSVSVTGRTGSLAYLAPEVDSRRSYNESADVFSFAVLMYQLFARKSLVLECRDTDGALEKLQMRMTEGYRPSKPPGCHADLWEVIDACWQPISTDRPLMDEVMQQLEAVVKEVEASEGWVELKKIVSLGSHNHFDVAASVASAGSAHKLVSGTSGKGGGAVAPVASNKPADMDRKASAEPTPAPPSCGCVIC